MIAEKRIVGISLLVAGLLLSMSMMCHAQEIGKLLEVKTPLKEGSKASLVEHGAMPLQGPTQAEKPAGQDPQKSWYLRLLNGIAIGFATINTQKQNDGRPAPPGSYR